MASVTTRGWDAFNRADETPLASPWVLQTAAGSAPALSSNRIIKAVAGDSMGYLPGAASGADQYAQMRIAGGAGGADGGPAVRVSFPSSSLNGYFVDPFGGGAVGRFLSSAFAKLNTGALYYPSFVTYTAAVNDILRIEIRGNTIKVFSNGIQLHDDTGANTWTDTAIPGAGNGVGFFLFDTLIFDDWQGGELDRGSALGSDYFIRADEFLTGGTHGWIILPSANSGMQILSGNVFGSSDPISASIVSGVTFPDDQWARCVWGGGGSDNGDDVGIGLILRGSNAATTCYTCLVNSTGDVWVGKYVAGTYTALGNTQLSFSVGDELWFEVVGTKLRVYKNDVQVGTDITDSSIASGAPGLIRKSSASNHVTSFHAGDFLGPKIIGVEQVDASGSSGTPSITVPIGTEAILAFWADFDATAQAGLTTLSLGGNAFTTLSEIETKQLSSDNTGTGVAKLENVPGIGSQTLSWAWEAGGARDEGGGLFIVFLENVNTGDISRAAATDSKTGGNIPSVVMSTISTDKCLALYQAFSAGGQDENDFVRGWENNVTVNSEHYWLLEAGYDFANNTDGIPDPGSGDYSTIAGIVLKRLVTAVEPPEAGDAGPTLIRLIGNRQTW